MNISYSDAGRYLCMASNPLSNSTVLFSLALDVAPRIKVKMYSLLVGLISAVSFLLITMFIQLMMLIVDRYVIMFIYIHDVYVNCRLMEY